MGVIEEIEELRNQGKTDSQIAQILSQEGYASQEIYESLSQTKIKEAVSTPSQDENQQEMQPSLINSSQQQEPQEQQYQYTQYPQYSQGQYQYSEQAQYPSGIASDTIAEIAEQVVLEKMSSAKTELEKNSEKVSALSTKIEYMDERLKRIEKTIDRLQLSILQKVGESLTNINDLKEEIIQTQKTFKALSPPYSQPQRKQKQEEN